VRVRRAHNDLAGFSIAIISVVYAVLLAFIAVATWESFSSAETIVQAEAGYIGNLYRDTVEILALAVWISLWERISIVAGWVGSVKIEVEVVCPHRKRTEVTL
jgi:hypothetical protein